MSRIHSQVFLGESIAILSIRGNPEGLTGAGGQGQNVSVTPPYAFRVAAEGENVENVD